MDLDGLRQYGARKEQMGHSRIRRALPSAGIILGASLSYSCAKEKPTETPEPAPAAAPADDNSAPGKDPAQAQIRISPGIAFPRDFSTR
jgi:hypothetical protein